MQITVGGLTFNTSDITSKGKYGKSGIAVFGTVGDVAVERVLKENFDLEDETLRKCQGHPNIITCHTIVIDSPYL